MGEFDYIPHGADKFVHLFFANDQRWRSFEHGKIVAADLCEDPVITK